MISDCPAVILLLLSGTIPSAVVAGAEDDGKDGDGDGRINNALFFFFIFVFIFNNVLLVFVFNFFVFACMFMFLFVFTFKLLLFVSDGDEVVVGVVIDNVVAVCTAREGFFEILMAIIDDRKDDDSVTRCNCF